MKEVSETTSVQKIGKRGFLGRRVPTSPWKVGESAGASADRVAEYFVSYLFNDFSGSGHVRRVAAWAGLIILGIERAVGGDWNISHTRQLWFTCGDRTFKAKYNHALRPAGGIEIVEVIPEQGNPDGDSVVKLRDLHEAEDFYNGAPTIFRKFLHEHAARVAS